MAVTSMRLVNVTGTLSRLDSVLSVCSHSDFQFEQAMSFFGSHSDFTSINDENPYSPYSTALRSAITEARLEPEPRENCDLPDNIAWDGVAAYIEEFTDRLKELNSACAGPGGIIAQTESELAQLRHFSDLDIRLQEIFDCEFIKVRFGRLPKDSFNKLKYYSENPYIMLMPCEKDEEFVWGVYFAPLDCVAEVDRVFQSLMWERMHIPNATETPRDECEAMERRIEQLRGEEAQAREALNAYWEENSLRCSALLYMLEDRADSFELRRYVAKYKTGDRFFLAGWAPKDSVGELESKIRQISDVECETEDATAAEGHAAPPVKLKNRALAKPFEFYVNMYGLPDYSEPDPTAFVAITYFLLFGMMFADVGQGIVLALVGWFFMWKRSRNELGRILTVCGVSSVIFGTLLGSVFGFEHWLDGFWGWVHQKTGIPLSDGKLINIENSSMKEKLIYATIGVGAVMVLSAMLFNVYSKLKQRMYGQALFSQNGVAGIVFYGSVVYAAVDMLLLGGNPLTAPYIIFCIVLPLILIFMQEPLSALLAGEERWLPENIVDFVASNFFEMFEVILSYVSNTVSFLRVGAFILVHNGMMMVVFTIAGFCKPGGAAYIITLVVGNLIVIVLEGLLSGIQALRLEYYEMFSRFYSGSGRPFNSVLHPAEEK